jgi:NAD(P)-dependent dehydrogenase (short-subunit alcohol dehydrogenase family)
MYGHMPREGGAGALCQGYCPQPRPKGIRANLVPPGNICFNGGVWNTIEKRNPEQFEMMLSLNPMGRMGAPREVANAAVFLASPRASFITGTSLIIDGALTRRVRSDRNPGYKLLCER